MPPADLFTRTASGAVSDDLSPEREALLRAVVGSAGPGATREPTFRCESGRNTHLGACWARPISVGSRVWIGGGATVLPGVTIGDGAVVGAGSVVTRDVSAHTVVVGSPAFVLRSITEADRTGYLPDR